jgi:hypothetical protein
MHILFYIVIILPQRLKLKNTALHQVRPIGADIPRMQSLPWVLACQGHYFRNALTRGLNPTLTKITNSFEGVIYLFFLCREFFRFLNLKIQFQFIQRIFYKINLLILPDFKKTNYKLMDF